MNAGGGCGSDRSVVMIDNICLWDLDRGVSPPDNDNTTHNGACLLNNV